MRLLQVERIELDDFVLRGVDETMSSRMSCMLTIVIARHDGGTAMDYTDIKTWSRGTIQGKAIQKMFARVRTKHIPYLAHT